MKTILFCSDLDNTLIFSLRYAKNEDLLIEINKGKPQGFMNRYVYDKIKDIMKGCVLVPITTRSIEQYQRIKWPLEPRFAIVANGGILLDNGKVDEKWKEHFRKDIEPFEKVFDELQEELISSDLFIRVRKVDDTYLFAYCKDEVDISEVVRKYKNHQGLNVVGSGKKIYFFPPRISKGEALEYFKSNYQFETVVSAGDSVIDLPMLVKSDVAIVPNGYLKKFIPDHVDVKVANSQDFSSFVVSEVLKICNSR